MWFGIVLLIIGSLIAVGLVFYRRYENFVNEHSVLIKNIKIINAKYHFNYIPVVKYIHSYDNEVYYNKVSPIDYLTYQLQFSQKEVKYNIKNVIENINRFDFYIADIDEIRKFDIYDVEVNLKFRKLLQVIEKNIYDKSILKPTLEFNIEVILKLTDINDKFIRSKKATFSMQQIEDLIDRINDKYNNRFNNERVWKSISSVERARVSNKMRFAVYKRDNYRCRKCGRKTNDLEIDHIIPIAKGGKTTFDNLQTLCKRCNEIKSDIIEPVTINTFNPNLRYCKKCKAPLKLVNGKYGKFYGCTNFPRCEYREKI